MEPQKTKPTDPTKTPDIITVAKPEESPTAILFEMPTRYFILSIVTLVLVAYTLPLAFFGLAALIGLFYYLYPVGLAVLSVHIFLEARRTKYREGIIKATMVLSIIALSLNALYLLISLFFIHILF